MPRTDLPVTNLVRTGLAPAAEVNGDVANGHSFVNDGKTFLLVRNAGGGPFTVTVDFGVTVDGQTVSPRVVSIPAGASRYFGPFPTSDYGSVTNVDVDATSGTNLKLSTYRVA